MSKIVSVTDDSFASTLEAAEGAVLVKFEAEWCGPCKAMKPMLEEVANENAGALKVISVNIDHSPKTPRKYNVRGLPTLLLFKNGAPVEQKVGMARKADVLAMLK